MSTEPGSAIPEPPRPICPHCEQTIDQVDFYPYPLEKIALITAACHRCHGLLQSSITILQPPGNPLDEQTPPSKIVMPS